MTHREGETGEYLELVVDGLVRVFVTAPDCRSMTVRLSRLAVDEEALREAVTARVSLRVDPQHGRLLRD